MENTLTKDYVTEKLFGPLVAGSVPIHMGVPNVHDFAPQHSVISVHDFKTPKDLAKYLLYLDKNETAYQEYLAWKYQSDFDPKFKALVDISKVHSFCRLCIQTADLDRVEFGAEKRPKSLPTFDSADLHAGVDVLPLWVRERGKFWAMPVVIRGDLTLEILKESIISTLRTEQQQQKAIVWSIYSRYNRTSFVTSDLDVRKLDPLTELEAIIVD